MLLNFLLSSLSVALPYVQVQLLKFPNLYYSVTEAILPLGFILGGIVLGTRAEVKLPLQFAWKSILAVGILILLMGGVLPLQLSMNQFFIFFIMAHFIFGLLSTMINVPLLTWLTKVIPAEYQGRVNNMIITISSLLAPLGIMFFSVLLDYVAPIWIFIGTGFLLCVLTFYWPRIFQLDLTKTELD